MLRDRARAQYAQPQDVLAPGQGAGRHQLHQWHGLYPRAARGLRPLAPLGNEGWSYDEVLPYFKRSEHKAEGANEYHGYGGPLWVEEVPNREKLELADLFVQAGVQTGLPYNEDFNGASQEGAGYYQLNIRKGAARAPPAPS